MGPGSKELMFLTQYCLDAETLIQAPSWVSYANQSTVLDIKTSPIQTTFEDKWKITPSSLDPVMSDKRQLVVINYPGNPTGMTYSESELKALAGKLDRLNTVVISDEIYNELLFEGRRTSISKYLPDTTMIFSGISKAHGAGGWRLGFCIVPDRLKEVKEAIVKVASETYSTASAPVQFAAMAAFDVRDEKLTRLLSDKARILSSISHRTIEKLNQHGIRCH